MDAKVIVTPPWKQRQDKQRKLFAVLVLLVVALSTFFVGWHMGSRHVRNLQDMFDQSVSDVSKLRNDNRHLLAENTKLSRKAQVQLEAVRTTQQSLKVLVTETSQLNRELEFYRRIIEPDKKIKHISAKEFLVSPGATGYQFRLVLVQDVKNQQAASGTVDVILLAGEPSRNQTLVASRKFKFKYFQLIEGSFEVPENFKPEEVLLRIKPRPAKGGVVEERIDWVHE